MDTKPGEYFQRWEEAASALSFLSARDSTQKIDDTIKKAAPFIQKVKSIQDPKPLFSPCPPKMRKQKAKIANAIAVEIRDAFLPFTKIQKNAIDAVQNEIGGEIKILPGGTAILKPDPARLAEAVNKRHGGKCSPRDAYRVHLDLDSLATVSSSGLSSELPAIHLAQILQMNGINATPIPAQLLDAAQRLARNREWRNAAYYAVEKKDTNRRRTLLHQRNAVIID